jgi:hypothetical protein
VGLVLIFREWLLDRGAQPPGNRPAPDDDPTIVTPGWHDLLDRSPRERYWPANRKDARWAYQAKEREMTVTSPDSRLLQLGRTSAKHYALEVTFNQHPWTGGVGVYYGDDLVADGPGKLKYYQVLLTPFESALDTRTCRFNHERVSSRGSGFAAFTIAGEDCPRPAPAEHTLKIRVGDRGLEGAWWDGAPLRKLVADNRPLPSTQGIGVIVTGSTVSVNRARLLIEE